MREGVTSFKLFMKYPGVFMLDDGSGFKARCNDSGSGSMVPVHAENGSGARDNAAGAELRERKQRSTTLYAPDDGGGRGNWPRHCTWRGRRARRFTSCTSAATMHLKKFGRRATVDFSLSPPLSAIFVSLDRELRCTRLRGSEIRVHSSASRSWWTQEKLCSKRA